MAYEARTKDEILRDLAARIVSRTELTDVIPGSILHTILATVAEEFASTEYRLGEIRDSFYLEGASGADLDERVSELPVRSISRLPAAPASGLVKLTRDSTVATATIEAGTLFGRKDNSKIFYRLNSQLTFGIGESEKTNVAVTCTTNGEVGNAGTGQVSIIVSNSDIATVVNEGPITGGLDEEGDDSLRSRAKAYLASLSRSQDLALEFEALNFVSEDGKRFTVAKIVSDPETPGYSELLVDDGTGLGAQTIPGFSGDTFTLDVPDPTVRKLHTMQINDAIFAPLEPNEPTPSGVSLVLLSHDNRFGGNPILGQGDGAYLTEGVHYIAAPERGVVYFLDSAYSNNTGVVFETGDEVFCPATRTYDSPSYKQIAELQRIIEGDPSNPTASPGLRAAGTRVRVLPAPVILVSMEIRCLFQSGSDLEVSRSEVTVAAAEFINQLGPGEPLYSNRLLAHLINNVSSLITGALYDSSGQTVLDDQYPTDDRHVLRADELTTSLTGE